MGIMDFINKISEKKKAEKEEFESMERELHFKKRLEEKMKTPMQKEHEFYQKEKEREQLKRIVESERKIRAEKMKELSNPFKENIRERNDLIKSNIGML